MRQDQTVNDEHRRDDWEFGGRYYLTTMFSDLDRDGMALEVEDVAPAPGRGQVLEIFFSDQTGDMMFTAMTTEPLPLRLIEHVVAEARRTLVPLD